MIGLRKLNTYGPKGPVAAPPTCPPILEMIVVPSFLVMRSENAVMVAAAWKLMSEMA